MLLWNMQSSPLSWSRRSAMRSASSAFGMLRRHHSKLNVAAQIDVDLWCPSCPLHPYLSSPSGCICKVCTQYKVPTTHAVFFTESSARGLWIAAVIYNRQERGEPHKYVSAIPFDNLTILNFYLHNQLPTWSGHISSDCFSVCYAGMLHRVPISCTSFQSKSWLTFWAVEFGKRFILKWALYNHQPTTHLRWADRKVNKTFLCWSQLENWLVF